MLKPDGTITKEKCKHLVTLKNGKTLCRIYKTRLGTMTSKTNRCSMRETFPFNIPGCSYNRKEWKECKFEE
jgi:hypothetical protein